MIMPLQSFARSVLPGLVCVLLLSGCAVFAPEPRDSPIPLPASYGFEDSATFTARGGGSCWWKTFGSQELDALVETALAGNFDMLTARARLDQLEAAARSSGSGLWPSLTGTAGADHSRRSTRASRDAPRLETTSDTLSLGAAMSYEVDLWGRVRSAYYSDVLGAAAGQEDLRTAAMTVAATTADTWLRLVAARQEIRLVQSQIETNAVLLQALSLRFANALSTGLDVVQQQEVYAASLAELPLLQAEESALLTELDILLGRAPGLGETVVTDTLPGLPPSPQAGLPADLLDQRPDVRAAWLSLAAADWSVSAARADRLPQLSLSADAAYSGPSSVLFSNWLTSLAAGLTAPLFDGGRREAEVDRTLAVVDERLQTYGKVVATAVGEVRDALVNEARQQEYLDRLADQLRFATIARDEAQLGYLNGRDDFLRFITEHKNVQGLERSMVRQEAVLLRHRVELHRALGGTF